MAEPLQGTEYSAGALKRVRYSHDAMIDLVLAQPAIREYQVAQYFGCSPQWVSRVFCSDSFQARLAQRKTELIDPGILASLEEKIKGLAHQSIEIIADKLEASKSPDLAVKALQLSTQALGFGARPQNVSVQTNTYVVALPEKAVSEADWATQAKKNIAALSPAAREVVDVEAK